MIRPHVPSLIFMLAFGFSAESLANVHETRAGQIIAALKQDQETRSTLESVTRLVGGSNVDDWIHKLSPCASTSVIHPPHAPRRIRSLFKSVRNDAHRIQRLDEIAVQTQSDERLIHIQHHSLWVEAWILNAGSICFPSSGSITEAAGFVLHQLLHLQSDDDFLSPIGFQNHSSTSEYLEARLYGPNGEQAIYEAQFDFLERNTEGVRESEAGLAQLVSETYMNHYQNEHARMRDFYRNQMGTLLNFLNNLTIAFENAGYAETSSERVHLVQDSRTVRDRLSRYSR